MASTRPQPHRYLQRLPGIAVQYQSDTSTSDRTPRTTTTIRRASRRVSLFDVSVGEDNLFKGDHYKWSLTLTAINITNKLALYNFLSTFSGTHYVTPRALTAQLGFHF